MKDNDDILVGLDHADESGPPREDYVELMHEYQKTKRQLKKAKSKIKILKAERKELRWKLAQAKGIEPEPQPAQPPYRGRWDGTLEKSVPEAFKFATALVNGSHRYPTRRTKKGDVRYLPPGYPFYPPYKQPLYLPPPPEDED